MTENEAIKNHKMAMEIYEKEFEKSEVVIDLYKTSISALEEIQKYRSIGTVEQFREAMEKQKAKIPYTYGDGDADGYPVIDMYECPNCGETYEIECDHYDYCPKCGQRMDRSELE